MSKRSALYEKYQTDTSAEVEGVWIRDVVDGVHVKVARWNNPKHKAATLRLSKPYQAQIDRQALDEETADSIVVRSMAEAIITDWEGMTDEAGKVLEPTLPNKLKILTDLPDLRADITLAARTQDLYRVASLEEAAKNSKGSSSGSSGGGD